MKVLVSGSAGLIGSSLIPFLTKKGHEVFKLVRMKGNLLENEIAWDPENNFINPESLEGLDVVVHLAGENLMGRWTQEKKNKIKESRVKGTHLLSAALSQLDRPPKVFICASAIGYYGNRGNEILTEHSSKGNGFLADVCEEWEDAVQTAVKKGIRTLNVRIGMVLSPKGGALKKMLPIFKLGLGGQIGEGDQEVSWISIDDLMRAIEFMMEKTELEGPINAISPHPVTNRELTHTLNKVLHRPTFFPMPSFVVQLFFGELGKELLLSSQYVLPKKLDEAGFRFDYPELENALRYLLNEKE